MDDTGEEIKKTERQTVLEQGDTYLDLGEMG